MKLHIDQKALCLCPEWCETGVQVAIWDGKKFNYPEASHDEFDRFVTKYIPLDEDGNPTRTSYLYYVKYENV